MAVTGTSDAWGVEYWAVDATASIGSVDFNAGADATLSANGALASFVHTTNAVDGFYAARFTSTFTLDSAEDITFFLGVCGEARLLIDGQPVIDVSVADLEDAGEGCAATGAATCLCQADSPYALEDGTLTLGPGAHTIELLYVDHPAGDAASLDWKVGDFGRMPMDLSIPEVWDGADAEGDGEWSDVIDLPIIPIHSIVLPNGKVLMFGTQENGGNYVAGEMVYVVWDPSSGEMELITNALEESLFCSQMSLDPTTGNVVIFSGSGNDDGVGSDRQIAVFDYRTNELRDSDVGELSTGRWYPTSLTLANGEILVLGGVDFDTGGYDGGGATTVEIYNSETGARVLGNVEFTTFAARTGDQKYGNWFYPGAYQREDGDVIVIEPEGAGVYRLDVSGDGSLERLADKPFGSLVGNGSIHYDRDKVMLIGSEGGVWIMDMSSDAPTFEKVNQLVSGRESAGLTMLADGRVAITGGGEGPNGLGNDLSKAVYHTTIWDPRDNSLEVVAEQALARLYHQTAISLPDGRIFSGGAGRPGPLDNFNFEVYTPAYLFDDAGELKDRPDILNAPVNIDAGDVFQITVDDAAAVARVTAIRSGGHTHATNSDVRFLDLDFTVVDGSTIDVSPPDGDAMPPGVWMLTTLDDAGTPSVAHMMGVDMAPIEAGVGVVGDAAVYNNEIEQINGAFEITLEGRFDRLDANAADEAAGGAPGAPQPLFVFADAAGAHTISLAQLPDSQTLRFLITVDGVAHVLDAEGSIVETAMAEWTVSVDDAGWMRILKDGVVLAEGQGAAPADVERTMTYGRAASDEDGDLVGLARNAAITLAVEPEDDSGDDVMGDDVLALSAAEYLAAGGNAVRVARVSTGTDVLENDILAGGGGAPEVTAVNGDPALVGVWVPAGNGGEMRIFSTGVVDFRDRAGDAPALADGETWETGVTYESGGQTHAAAVRVTGGDGPAPAVFEAEEDRYAIEESDYLGSGGGLIRVGRVSDGTSVTANDTNPAPGAMTITAVNGDPALVGQWVPGSNGGEIRIFASGVMDWRDRAGDVGDVAAGDTFTSAATYTVTNSAGETATATATVAIEGDTAPVVMEAADDVYTVAEGDFTGARIRLGATSQGTDLLENDSAGAVVTAVNGDASLVGQWIMTDAGVELRVFSTGVVDVRDRDGTLPDPAFGEVIEASVSYTATLGGVSDEATATLVITSDDEAPADTDARLTVIDPYAIDGADPVLFSETEQFTGGERDSRVRTITLKNDGTDDLVVNGLSFSDDQFGLVSPTLGSVRSGNADYDDDFGNFLGRFGGWESIGVSGGGTTVQPGADVDASGFVALADQPDNLIVNGNFNDGGTGPSGDVTGWTKDGGSGGVFSSATRLLDGRGYALGGWTGETGSSVYQTIDTAVGQAYTLNLSAGMTFGSTNILVITAEGPSGVREIARIEDDGATVPQVYSFDFTAEDSETIIRFRQEEGNGDIDIDAVSMFATSGLVVNGSFEGPVGVAVDITGWSSANGGIEAWANGFIELDQYGATTQPTVDAVFQDIQTEAGKAYALTFSAAQRDNQSESIQVYWAGKLVDTVTPDADGAFDTFEIEVTGSGGMDRLEFRELAAENNGLGPFLDNVSMVETPTLILNGGFEAETSGPDGDVSGWTRIGDGGTFTSASRATEGDAYAIGGWGSAVGSGVEQTVATVENAAYSLSFDVGMTYAGGGTLEVVADSADGARTLGVLTQADVGDRGSFSYDFVADSAETTLRFVMTDGTGDIDLDQVALETTTAQLGEGATVQRSFALTPGQTSAVATFDFLEFDGWADDEFTVYVNGQAVSLGLFSSDSAEFEDGASAVRSGASGGVSWVMTHDADISNRAFGSGGDQIHTVTLTVANPGDALELGFGSSLTVDPDQGSFGIDNLTIATSGPAGDVAEVSQTYGSGAFGWTDLTRDAQETSFTLAPGETRDIDIYFDGDNPGDGLAAPVDAVLTIASNSETPGAETEVELSGLWQLRRGGALEAEPDDITSVFGWTDLTRDAQETSFTLAPGETRDIDIYFDGDNPGDGLAAPVDAVLTIESNSETPGAETEVELSGLWQLRRGGALEAEPDDITSVFGWTNDADGFLATRDDINTWYRLETVRGETTIDIDGEDAPVFYWSQADADQQVTVTQVYGFVGAMRAYSYDYTGSITSDVEVQNHSLEFTNRTAEMFDLVNGDFEDVVIGNYTNGTPGWSRDGSSGAINPSDTLIVSGVGGENTGWINSGSMTNSLTDLAVAGQAYEVSLSVGDRSDQGASNYTIQLMAGETVIAETSGVTLDNDGLNDISFSGVASAEAAGEAMSIVVTKNSGGQLNFDDVELRSLGQLADNTWLNEAPAGWAHETTSGGPWNPPAGRLNTGVDGETVGHLNNGALTQTLTTVAQEDYTYAFTIAIGDRTDSGASNYILRIMAGDEVIAEQAGSTGDNNGLTDVTISGEASAAAAGQQLRIEVEKVSGGQLNFDNARVTQTTSGHVDEFLSYADEELIVETINDSPYSQVAALLPRMADGDFTRMEFDSADPFSFFFYNSWADPHRNSTGYEHRYIEVFNDGERVDNTYLVFIDGLGGNNDMDDQIMLVENITPFLG